MDAHNVLRVGYMNNYMPFSTTADGATTGIVVDVVPLLLQKLGIDDKLGVEYVGFDDNKSMYAALKSGAVDTAFPAYGEPAFAESNGAVFSSGVIEITVDLAYKGDYSDRVTKRVAVNRYNHLQDYYTKQYYPDAEILYYDNIAGCLDAIAAGEADSTLLNGFRTRALLSGVKYASLNASPVPGTIDLCFAVEKNNTGLLSLLNRAVGGTEKAAVTAFTYGYVNDMNTYTVNDFVRDNLLLVILVITAFILVAGALVITRIRSRAAKKEFLQRIELEKRTERVKSIISAMAEDYDYISSTDIETGEITQYVATDKFYRVESRIDHSLPAQERLEKLLKAIVHPKEWERFLLLTSRENLKAELEKNPVYKFDCLTVSPEGKEEYYRFKFAYLPEEPNLRIMGILSIDESIRREMEAALLKERAGKAAELKEQMARIMELSDDFQAIFDVDSETGKYDIFSYDNAYADDVLVKMEKGSNFYADALKDVEKVVYPDDRDLIRDTFSNKEYIRKTLAEQGYFTIDYRLLYSGKPAWYRVKVVKKAGPDDHFLVGVFNIDEKYRKEVEYKKNIERELKVINGLASDCVSLYTADLDNDSFKVYSITDEVKDINTVVSSLNGITRALRQYADGYIHEEDREKIVYFADPDHIRDALRHSRSHKVTVRRKLDGEWIWIEMNLIKTEPVSEPANNVIFAFTNRDEQIKNELEVRKQLKDAALAAESASQAKTAFLNSMSHDIRTPMNAITGYTRMAKKNIGNAESVEQYLDKIEISGQHLLTLINRVLEMSRIESGKVVLAEEQADVVERAYAMQTISGADVDRKGLTYSLIIHDIPHRHVLTDGSRMNQIITNILGNAIKYTPEGGHIDYVVEELPSDRDGYGLYRFTIADTGIGMSEEYLEHIFEEFTRENTSTVSKIMGTGLGMPIVKSLVDLMGGNIDVKSKQGAGTTVTITMPMKIDNGFSSQEAEEAVFENVDFSGKRLLLVEDNEMNREIACDILDEAGFIVETAEDGDIAVDMVRKTLADGDPQYYDAVIMDIQMPRMDGYEATKQIRALSSSGRHIPIIAMTANAFEEDRIAALEAGMDAHIAKPIDIQKLKDTLAKQL